MTHEHSDGTLTGATTIFVSFLYAASVHLIIHNAHNGGHVTWTSAVIVVGAMIFIFSDWSSRTRLPRLMPEEEKQKFSAVTILLKGLLEIVGVFFLVMTMLELLSAVPTNGLRELDAPLAFAVFLVLTALWNYLMIRIMTLDLPDVAKAVFRGNTADLPIIRRYFANVTTYARHKKHLIEMQPTEKLAPLVGEVLWLKVFWTFVGGSMQLIANHVAHANVLVACLILYSEFSLDGRPLLTGPRATILKYIENATPGERTAWDILFVVIIVTVLASILGILINKRVGGITAAIMVVLFVAARVVFSAQLLAITNWIFALFVILLMFTLVFVPFAFVAALRSHAGTGDGADAPPPDGKAVRVWQHIGAVTTICAMVLTYVMWSAAQLIAVMAIEQLLANAFLQAYASPEAASAKFQSIYASD